MSKLWFSIFDFTFLYKGDEPSYINSSSFNWANELELNATIIKNELATYLDKHNLESYFNTSMVTKKNSWRTIALKNWNIELYKNQLFFPQTTALLNKYPQIISASFNLLESKSKILPHCGDTNGIYRCHLGLDIPEGLPLCGFKVRGEEKAWQNNKWLIFMDAYTHEAWNDSDKDRYIFLIDVLRDEFKNQKNEIYSTVRASLFLQKRAEKFKRLQTVNPKIIKLLTLILKPFALFATFMCNKLKIY